MKPPPLISILIICALWPNPAQSQQSISTVTIAGSVMPAVMLEPSIGVESVGIYAQLIPMGRKKALVKLAGISSDQSSYVVIQLLLRTNTGYELWAEPVAGKSPVSVSVLSVAPTGSGVVPSALSGVKVLQSSAVLSEKPLMVASGTRISTGSASSTGNALAMKVKLEIGPAPQGNWSAEVVFAIEPARSP